MLARFLSENHDVTITLGAETALEHLTSHAPPDVVLCDVMMPRTTGMDLFAAVADRHPGLEKRFVFMTGGAFTPRAAEFLSRVPNPRLEKPFSFSDVASVIDADQ
jgi:DNA-binding NtrC family response regulator